MSLLGKLMDTMRLSAEDDEDDYYLDDETCQLRSKQEISGHHAPVQRTGFAAGLVLTHPPN